MASCGGLQQIFENPLPENPSLIESLSSSWNQIKPMKPIELSSLTEIFGELHFKEKPESHSSLPPFLTPSSSSLSSPSLMDVNSEANMEKLNENNKESSLETQKNSYLGCSKKSERFPSKKSENLQLCTEGLGFESFDDVEDSKNEREDDMKNHKGKEKEKVSIMKYSSRENQEEEFRGSKTSFKSFPPPISCIGMGGKPCVCLKSYRHDGRFVLKEIRIPNHEVLHAFREDGRLKLQLVHPDEEIQEEEDDDNNDNDEEEKAESIKDEIEGDQ